MDTSSKLRGHVVGNHEWHYHGAQFDVENKYQQLGSKKVIEKMKALLQGSVNDYREAFSHAPHFNPEVRALLDSITVTRPICAASIRTSSAALPVTKTIQTHLMTKRKPSPSARRALTGSNDTPEPSGRGYKSTTSLVTLRCAFCHACAMPTPSALCSSRSPVFVGDRRASLHVVAASFTGGRLQTRGQ